MDRRRWLAVAFVALSVVGAAFVVWYSTSLPSLAVDEPMRETVAARVYELAGPRLGEDVVDLDRRILEVASRDGDSWICVGNWPAVELYGIGYWRQEYRFNDNSSLLVYSGDSVDGSVREFDGVVIEMHEPLYR